MSSSSWLSPDEKESVQNEYKFVDANSYVSSNAEWHYKSNFNSGHSSDVPYKSNAPYLWTSAITFCVGVAYIYQPPDGSPAKIGLYHSRTEHIDTESPGCQNFRKAFTSFIKNVADMKDLKVVLCYNSHFNQEFAVDRDMNHIYELLNTICTLTGKSAIPEENISSLNGLTDTFYVTENGDTGILRDDAEFAIEDIANLVRASLDENELKKKPFASVLQISDSLTEFNIVNSLNKIKTKISDYLLSFKNTNLSKKIFASDISQEQKILCLKIIAWDAILEKPSPALLQVWMKENKYKISDEISASVFTPITIPAPEKKLT